MNSVGVVMLSPICLGAIVLEKNYHFAAVLLAIIPRGYPFSWYVSVKARVCACVKNFCRKWVTKLDFDIMVEFTQPWKTKQPVLDFAEKN